VNSLADSPHRVITKSQDQRSATRNNRTYVEELDWAKRDLEAAGVPPQTINAAIVANNQYYKPIWLSMTSIAERDQIFGDVSRLNW
jgi:hypothetical protein